MPPAFSLSHLTASFAPSVAQGPMSVGPPCWFTKPMTIGFLLWSAAPALPPTYL